MTVPGPQKLEGFSVWKDFVHDHFPWLEHRNHCSGRFSARVTTHRVCSFEFATIQASASEVIRTRHLAEAAENGFVKLLWQKSGALFLEQDGKHCSLEPGEFAVCDTVRPYRVGLSDAATFAVLMLPHDSISGWHYLSSKVCGTKLTDVARPKVAFEALTTLVGLPSETIRDEGESVLQAVQSLLSASIQQAGGVSSDASARDARLHKARRHIVENIGNPGLGPDDLATTLCMSRRALYLLFKGHQITPAKMIHDIRLERAHCCIDDERNDHRKMTDIALDLGFSDYATFSRLFRARFGVTPSEHRMRRRFAKSPPVVPNG
ncbi:hypothetical protein B1810_11285 [Panacagrimonas perspica]|nr:hypothetical protein B1810_11285 [Panacagrimonas perspica]